MRTTISRRDYLNGMALAAAGAATLGPRALLSTANAAATTELSHSYYPPTLTGLRGSHEGAFEVSHALAWNGEKPAEYRDLDESYDLVVVGAGLSGLAAAYFFQQHSGGRARILLLDNHDDFGGHAKRNEFHYMEHMLLAAGGSGNFENPSDYSKQTKDLLIELGFDLEKIKSAMHPDYFGAKVGMYTDNDSFGADQIVHGEWNYAWHGVGDYEGLVNALPLPDSERKKLVGFIDGSLPLQKALPSKDIEQALSRISYKTFLTDYVGLEERTCSLWHPIMSLTYLVGLDCLSVKEGLYSGLPGINILGADVAKALGLNDLGYKHELFWMPDGNASLARQMVRRLIPNVAGGSSLESLVTARFEYSQLDRPDNMARIRLNSSAVNVAHEADGDVRISYVQKGEALLVRAKRCILACYNGLIPHLCPEISDEQKQSLQYGVKGPILIANVLVRDGRAFYKAGSEIFQCPTSYFGMVTKVPPTNIGDYKVSSDPKDPMIIYMLAAPAATPNEGGMTARDLYRAGRRQLYATDFQTYEREIRDQLNGMFGATGFDADRDVEAITLNRWSHGYAYYYLELFDPKWPKGQAPHELGRKPFGRISIANSDSESLPTVNGAVNAAWRAVQDQLN